MATLARFKLTRRTNSRDETSCMYRVDRSETRNPLYVCDRDIEIYILAIMLFQINQRKVLSVAETVED